MGRAAAGQLCECCQVVEIPQSQRQVVSLSHGLRWRCDRCRMGCPGTGACRFVAPALAARCPRCGGAVVKAHGEASCLACGHEVVAVVRAWETAPGIPVRDGTGRRNRANSSGHEVPWTDEERRAWREWKPGDPVPIEDEHGLNKWICPDCGFETGNRWAPRHKAECTGAKEEPMDQGEMADKIRVANMPMGRFDIQTLRTQVQGRIDELVGLIQRERERSAERIAVANEELGQMRKALVALGVKPEAKAAVSKSTARADGTSRNSWTCPDCGHVTVTRWVARHKAECKEVGS